MSLDLFVLRIWDALGALIGNVSGLEKLVVCIEALGLVQAGRCEMDAMVLMMTDNDGTEITLDDKG